MISGFDFLGYVETRCDARKAAKGEYLLRTCPNCGSREHCSVNPAKQKWRCFKCGWAGKDPERFIAKIEGCDLGQAREIMLEDAFDQRRPEQLAEWADKVTAVVEEAPPVRTWRDDMPKEYIPCYDKATGKWNGMPLYLKERGITRETCMIFRLGWCDDGHYARRIIIPITTGDVTSFQARATWTTTRHERKYDTPPNAPLSQLLMGYDMLVPGQEVWLVEGPFDKLGCHQAGIPAVPLTGKEMSEAQANLIVRLRPPAVHVMLDEDAEIWARRIAAKLSYRVPKVDMVLLHGGDPGSLKPDDLLEQAMRQTPSGSHGLAKLLTKARALSRT